MVDAFQLRSGLSMDVERDVSFQPLKGTLFVEEKDGSLHYWMVS